MARGAPKKTKISEVIEIEAPPAPDVIPEKEHEACPNCGVHIKKEWPTCPECGFRIHEHEARLKHYYPQKGRKEYLKCSECGEPIKEEESYYDTKGKVYLHIRCKRDFMKHVAAGEEKVEKGEHEH